MEKRLLLAITLSIIVMLLYPFVMAKIYPPQESRQITQQIANEEVIETKSIVLEENPNAPGLTGELTTEKFSNDKYDIEFVDIGGSIRNIKIKDGKINDIDLVKDAVLGSGILAVEGKGALSGLSSQPFAIKPDTNTLVAEKNNLIIEKNIKFLKDQYGAVVYLTITNASQSSQALSFELTTASNISSNEAYESRFIGADVLYKDGSFKRIASGNFKKYNKLYNSNIEWLSFSNKYYSIIAKPGFTPSGVFTKNVSGQGVAGFIVEDEISPGQKKSYEILFYIGPTQLSELEKVDRNFKKALNLGIFTSIGLVLLSALKFFYGLSHNYGIAILLLTLCVSLLLFPLTFKSLKSMRKLQEVQPQIEKIRAERKDNPQKLNKEIMELYRRYNVNPMSGCIPVFLQMPLFIALYQTLMRSVELKGAHFLWIKDLSMPDAAFRLPLILPFLGNAINLLPILMIGAMIIQQRLSQSNAVACQTEQQKIISNIMPVMFGVIFYSLPSGLVLYWLTNTVLTSALQYMFLKKA